MELRPSPPGNCSATLSPVQAALPFPPSARLSGLQLVTVYHPALDDYLQRHTDQFLQWDSSTNALTD